MRAVHEAAFDVQKYFEKDELRDLLERVGFRDVRVYPIFKSEFSERWFIRVMENPKEYFGFFKRFYAFFLYYVIVWHERRVTQDDHGTFNSEFSMPGWLLCIGRNREVVPYIDLTTHLGHQSFQGRLDFWMDPPSD